MYLLHKKDGALQMFNTIKAEVEYQLETKTKILRSNCGGEYEFKEFAELCVIHDITHQTSPLPVLNSIEWLNRK